MKKKLCLLAALSLSLFSLVSCQQIQARTEIKTANEAYAKEDYATALKHYVEARKHAGDEFPDLDRMIGYSHIGIYVPDDKSPQNTANVDKAVTELRTYLKKKPDDGIARDALINLYLNAERTTEAINYFRDWLTTHPGDLSAVKSIATLYAKQGNFNESLNWYEKITLLDARNPEAFYIYGVVCYEKVAKDPPADMAERLALIEKGKGALQKSIEIKPDYFESMAYLNLLYRQQALIETDPAKQQALIAQADEVRGRALEIIRKKKAAAAPAGAAKQS
ncbi:MAG TPA: tetratricopeptide repeat protein [Thermoanaerobaculia bacterium]